MNLYLSNRKNSIHPACRKRSSFYWAFLLIYGKIVAVMKVIVKGRENREQIEIFSIEEFVPADHLLRKIDSAIDFTHIYDIVEDFIVQTTADRV